MARRDRGHASTALRVVVSLLVLVLVAGVSVSVFGTKLLDPRLGLGGGRSGEGDRGPAAVPPPPGLDLPAATTPPPVAEEATSSGGRGARGLDADAVRRALATGLQDKALGPHVLYRVSTLDGELVARRGSGSAIPASVTKLLTSEAALDVLGPEHVFRTQVVAGGGHRIVLVGGGDPLLAGAPVEGDYPARADLTTLARTAARALRAQGTRRARLGYDDSLFSGPQVNPHWPATYIPEAVVAPITALWANEGRPASGTGRVSDPSLAAATVFAGVLSRNGVKVIGLPIRGVASPSGRVLASVRSAPLREIVDHVLQLSDNEGAEVLARQVGVAVSGKGSFVGGVAAVRSTLAGLGVPLTTSRWYDGSGLSREGRLTPVTLTGVLATAASREHPDLASILASLPVAGFNGSLASRLGDGPAAGLGRVRAKTGTLSNVTSLAGIATGVDNEPMIFVLMADKISLPNSLLARIAMDDAAGALGACRCGS